MAMIHINSLFVAAVAALAATSASAVRWERPFTQGVSSVSSGERCLSYNAWRTGLPPNPAITNIVAGSSNGDPISCVSNVDALANQLRSNTQGEVECDGHWWRMGPCGGGLELRVSKLIGQHICSCPILPTDQVIMRPCIGNNNWGGSGGSTCGGGSQSIYLEYNAVVGDVCPAAVDMTLIIDSSGSVSGEDRDNAVAFAKSVVAHFSVSQAASDTRVAVVEFSTRVTERMLLNEATSNADVDAVLDADRDNTIGKQTNTPVAALNYVRDNVYTAPNGARAGVRRVVVVVTNAGSTVDGSATSLVTEVGTAADALRAATGATVVAVGYGRDSDIHPELLELTNDDESLVFSTHFSKWLGNHLDGVRYAACGVTTTAVPTTEEGV